jgi:hypothetical protein
MIINNPNIKIIREVEIFARKRHELLKLHGVSFDPDEFMRKVENTRLTTHMNLQQAFEYEKSKLK